MSGPAPAGLFLYAKDLPGVAAFYQGVLGLQRLSADDDLVVLQGQGVQLVLHAIPAHIAQHIHISKPPQPREETPMKFFFTVPAIADARAAAPALGGEVTMKHYEGPGFRVCNAIDPEGNIFQVREATP